MKTVNSARGGRFARAARRRVVRAGVCAAALAALVGTSATAASAEAPSPPPAVQADVPAGVTAGVAVFDRRTGTFTEQLNTAGQFRSASVVKLLIALDVLWNRAPDSLPAADRSRIESMLRGSDDAAASTFWANNGGGAIIDRMVPRLGLTDTARPPSTHPGFWGYTALSARDTVKIYRYLLDSAPAAVRDHVLGNLRQSIRCATDGYDQHFGIAGSFSRPWAVKQGWSGFSSGGCTAPAATAAKEPRVDAGRPAGSGTRTPAGADAVDLTRPALHTTGVVGAGDRSIVVVGAVMLHRESRCASSDQTNRIPAMTAAASTAPRLPTLRVPVPQRA
ncbi:hypothetical protein [Streptomyces sp. NPDC047706]|uniref:hypothetical protein n=1 Tax=Streptomyces sp. NPDC047706 TaxID=3365486 RepID=UPI0037115834